VIGQLFGSKVVAIDIRQDELDEAPSGPIKVCADAKQLSFTDGYFAAATAFYFFLYVNATDYLPVLKEAFRVLRPGGSLYIWDTAITTKTPKAKNLYIVPITVKLPEKVVHTAYGVNWVNRNLCSEIIASQAISAGFVIGSKVKKGQAFFLECMKPDFYS